MKSAHIVTNRRPVQGLAAFVPVSVIQSAMKSFGGCMNAGHQGLPASYELDRAKDQMHPGEGCA